MRKFKFYCFRVYGVGKPEILYLDWKHRFWFLCQDSGSFEADRKHIIVGGTKCDGRRGFQYVLISDNDAEFATLQTRNFIENLQINADATLSNNNADGTRRIVRNAKFIKTSELVSSLR